MPDALQRLKVLINSSTPIVVMETVEETRAVALVREASAELNLPTFEWSIADGLVRSGTLAPASPGGAVGQIESSKWTSADGFFRTEVKTTTIPVDRAKLQDAIAAMAASVSAKSAAGTQTAIYNTKEPAQALANMASMSLQAVFILKDFHRHMDDPVVIRRLREVAQKFSTARQTVVLTGPSIAIPAEISALVEFLELPLPDRRRLRQIIDEVFNQVSKTRTLQRRADVNVLNAIAENLRGLTEDEAERAVTQAIVTRYALCPEVVTDVLEAKKDMLRRTGLLDIIDVTDDMSSIGGLENLKTWLRQRKGAWEPAAREFGLESPRGMIVLGVQGCGKSLCARAVAGEWKLPLLKFQTAAVFDKFLGETEKRIQKLFQVAEQLAPAVLWIDELEKVFAGTGTDAAASDAGTSSRMLGAFLSWMQDRKAPVFIAATSNNVMALPPELIRKGRFDELFFVDLPNSVERRAIFTIQLTRRKRNASEFDLARLVTASKGYSGAELDTAIQTAMYAAFSEKKPLTTEAILQALATSVPLSTTRAEDIEALRAWARERAVPASVPESRAEQA
jgi:ATPase family protein associated with various cellular activities (AAA)